MGLKCCTNPKSFPLRDGHARISLVTRRCADSDPIRSTQDSSSSEFAVPRPSSPRTAHCQLCLSVPDRDMPDRDRVGVGYRRVFCISTTFVKTIRYGTFDHGSICFRHDASRLASPTTYARHIRLWSPEADRIPANQHIEAREAVPASVPGPGVSGPRWRHAHAGWRPGFR